MLSSGRNEVCKKNLVRGTIRAAARTKARQRQLCIPPSSPTPPKEPRGQCGFGGCLMCSFLVHGYGPAAARTRAHTHTHTHQIMPALSQCFLACLGGCCGANTLSRMCICVGVRSLVFAAAGLRSTRGESMRERERGVERGGRGGDDTTFMLSLCCHPPQGSAPAAKALREINKGINRLRPSVHAEQLISVSTSRASCAFVRVCAPSMCSSASFHACACTRRQHRATTSETPPVLA